MIYEARRDRGPRARDNSRTPCWPIAEGPRESRAGEGATHSKVVRRPNETRAARQSSALAPSDRLLVSSSTARNERATARSVPEQLAVPISVSPRLFVEPGRTAPGIGAVLRARRRRSGRNARLSRKAVGGWLAEWLTRLFACCAFARRFRRWRFSRERVDTASSTAWEVPE